jgi:hypothetical protein
LITVERGGVLRRRPQQPEAKLAGLVVQSGDDLVAVLLVDEQFL